MTSDATITTYRAAAAKLGEALAAGDAPCEATNLVYEAAAAAECGQTAAGDGLDWCADWRGRVDNPTGWRWLTEAARLRLLAEACILEQQDRIEGPRREGWRLDLGYQAELGSLVRETLADGGRE
ncbi:MAG TPA: hypothetical protein VN837_05525 [Chloroflexota bacterium]|nr:hypothetical protein [Chloroflexota bacterium]